jgi:hypothetical protein
VWGVPRVPWALWVLVDSNTSISIILYHLDILQSLMSLLNPASWVDNETYPLTYPMTYPQFALLGFRTEEVITSRDSTRVLE